MKRTTKKLSGTGLELFLRRFYGNYGDIDADLARTLAKDGTRTFSSVRVRQQAWHTWRSRTLAPTEPAVRGGEATIAARPLASGLGLAAAPGRQTADPVATPTEAPASDVASDAGPNVAFDPYAIGLVPTYQREGADGLLAKLSEITSIDNLRKMARSQQVALPAELRAPDADIAAIRSAIVDAVDKRIANRRAAAG